MISGEVPASVWCQRELWSIRVSFTSWQRSSASLSYTSLVCGNGLPWDRYRLPDIRHSQCLSLSPSLYGQDIPGHSCEDCSCKAMAGKTERWRKAKVNLMGYFQGPSSLYLQWSHAVNLACSIFLAPGHINAFVIACDQKLSNQTIEKHHKKGRGEVKHHLLENGINWEGIKNRAKLCLVTLFEPLYRLDWRLNQNFSDKAVITFPFYAWFSLSWFLLLAMKTVIF